MKADLAISLAFETLSGLAQWANRTYKKNGKLIDVPDHATRRKAAELLQAYSDTPEYIEWKQKQPSPSASSLEAGS